MISRRSRPLLSALLALLAFTSLPLQGQEPAGDAPLPEGELRWGGFLGSFSVEEGFELRGDGWPTLAGTVEVEGAELVLTLTEPVENCAEPGRYEFAVEDGRLHLTLVEDSCMPRQMILGASSWRPASEPEVVPERRLELTVADELPDLPEPADADGAWPSFRGPSAAGVADGQSLPDEWNGETGENILWKIDIPGLAHSSPVVWGDRVYVTSAISSDPDASFQPGLYGAGTASEDKTPHRWMIYAVDKNSGEIVWERAAHEGVPVDKRHIKSTYASSSPATDGRVVVAWFGSEGLFAYTVDGDFLWRLDVGRIDVGAYDIPSFEWGPASSPLLWEGRVFLQVDTQQDSFLLALDSASDELLWKSERDELPSWGSPTIVDGPEGPELVTNASNFIRGYDPHTGEELWRLGGSSKITAPTPVASDGLVVVASGRRPEQPIFVLQAGARGELTLPPDTTSSEAIVWSVTRRGPYMPTPLIYGELLYVLGNGGILDAYELTTGEEVYRSRIPHLGSGFSASPVAADGRLYLSNEDGDIVVVRAGREFEHLATNPMGELLMATPALSDGVLYVRSASGLFAVGRASRTPVQDEEGPGWAAGAPVDTGGVASGRYASMETLYERTIFNVDVLHLTIGFGPETARDLEQIVSGRSYDTAIAGSVTGTALAARDVLIRSRFLRSVSLEQFLDGVRDNLADATRAGLIREAERDEIAASMAERYEVLRQRGIGHGDTIWYRVRGDRVESVFESAGGETPIRLMMVGNHHRRALLGGYLAPDSDFREGLVRSLFAG